ncbi:hypothetical protein B0H10DRAFT_1968570 [Mycena sp. CBHHK59/15]|nr:hypothetical protein B0H10DRAFT_1968570 [Mycena sp. CBHHK59/15]
MALKFTLLRGIENENIIVYYLVRAMAQAWAKPSQARIPGFGSGLGFLKPGLSHGEGSYEVISEGVEDLIEAKAGLRNAKPEVWPQLGSGLNRWPEPDFLTTRHTPGQYCGMPSTQPRSEYSTSQTLQILKYQYFVYITCSKGLGDLSTSQTLQTIRKQLTKLWLAFHQCDQDWLDNIQSVWLASKLQKPTKRSSIYQS